MGSLRGCKRGGSSGGAASDRKKTIRDVYLAVGGGRYLFSRGIVGIFDLDSATVSPVTRDFLRRAEAHGESVNVRAQLPKSFLLYDDGVREAVVFSPLGTRTIGRR